MIEFLTLFLGLVVGEQHVAVAVEPPVERVEIRLDGAALGELTGAPWAGSFDFGRQLLPHVLEAVGRDGEGREVDRARQWVNVPTDRAAARLVPEHRDGKVVAVRLTWRSMDLERPASVSLSFDGQPLAVPSVERFELPPHDPESVHFLRARLLFTDGVEATAEMVFGSSYGDRISFDLTAVPLAVERGKLPPVAAMAGWLTAAGEPLAPVAADHGSLELLVVRESAEATFERLRELAAQQQHLRRGPLPFEQGTLGTDDRIRFVFPTAESSRAPGELTEQLPVSVDVAHFGDGTLLGVLSGAVFADLEVPMPEQRIADAVAIAGLVAAGTKHPRAVLLLLSGASRDVSRFDPAVVRGYLQRLGVPLFVWSLTEPQAAGPWGEVTDVSSLKGMRLAIHELLEQLDGQWITWVDGRHLPGSVRLTGRAEGVRLAGSPAGS